MKVLFVSQCSKNAIKETRRIIDQFAERKGDFVWETSITEQGLETVKKILKATARKNTAVACHVFRGRLQTELLWIVGNSRKFNSEGSVPTNITQRDILRTKDENSWNTVESIAILASLAGLFHDFGKANALFQDKLSKGKATCEPFRHEWISLLLFREFVKGKTDEEWLVKLTKITPTDEAQLLKNLPKNSELLKQNPLSGLPQLAKFIGWLILSHHRLPVYPDRDDAAPRLDDINEWINGKRLTALWNSPQCDETWSLRDIKSVISFPEGTPLQSKTWCFNASKAASRALKYYSNLDKNWFHDRFSMHLARLALMLSDHCYSADVAQLKYQDSTYNAYANTDKTDGKRKQKLDEHNIGVARNSFFIAKTFPKLHETLPAITRHKGFKKRNANPQFGWQDNAFDLAYSLKHASKEKGFFGVNLASTGSGKTLANARIMYGLSNEKLGCRFCIALGLRTLTLQTGDSLQDKLSLKSDDIAVLIGSKAHQALYSHNNEVNVQNVKDNGSESQQDFFEEQEYVRYDGSLDDGYLGRWLRQTPKLHKILSAPILVCTTDHLIPATEGSRGGKQIAPILRLLTSDLVLDEPDDFDVNDLPALSRLVNFAGVFGSRVLLSSATLPPAIVQALLDAYIAGRKIFNHACGDSSLSSEVCCAWFDEFGVASSSHANAVTYMNAHHAFIKHRVDKLQQQPILRKACLASVDSKSCTVTDVRYAMANTIRESMYKQHEHHHQVCPRSKKKVSIGLVRMANINEMVAILKQVLSDPTKFGYAIHFCAYHSRFPLLIRSRIENTLDNALTRHTLHKIWETPEITRSICDKQELNHIFVVFASSVAEVGRDHDYDWAIVEPSSMRSIVQVAGRVQRHRQIPQLQPNVLILENNLRGLKGENLAYCNPGFESDAFNLRVKKLSVSLSPFQYENISSIPRISPSSQLDHTSNLSDLEHARLQAELLGIGKSGFHASLWWKHNVDWCAEIQRRSLFRKNSGEDEEYFYYLKESDKEAILHQRDKYGNHGPVEKTFFNTCHFQPAQGIYPWIECNVNKEIEKLANEMGMNLWDISWKFTTVRLKTLCDGEKWTRDPVLGFYRMK